MIDKDFQVWYAPSSTERERERDVFINKKLLTYQRDKKSRKKLLTYNISLYLARQCSFHILWLAYSLLDVGCFASENFLKRPNQMYLCILVTLTLYIMRITLILKNNKNILQNIFTYIFILTYTLNAPKINDLYMTKKAILKKKKKR